MKLTTQSSLLIKWRSQKPEPTSTKSTVQLPKIAVWLNGVLMILSKVSKYHLTIVSPLYCGYKWPSPSQCRWSQRCNYSRLPCSSMSLRLNIVQRAMHSLVLRLKEQTGYYQSSIVCQLSRWHINSRVSDGRLRPSSALKLARSSMYLFRRYWHSSDAPSFTPFQCTVDLHGANIKSSMNGSIYQWSPRSI